MHILYFSNLLWNYIKYGSDFEISYFSVCFLTKIIQRINLVNLVTFSITELEQNRQKSQNNFHINLLFNKS